MFPLQKGKVHLSEISLLDGRLGKSNSVVKGYRVGGRAHFDHRKTTSAILCDRTKLQSEKTVQAFRRGEEALKVGGKFSERKVRGVSPSAPQKTDLLKGVKQQK